MSNQTEKEYIVNDYFLEKLTKLTPEEIETYKRLHVVNESRERVFLRAAYDLLKSCNNGVYVKNALSVPIVYDGNEKDGYSLANDIADLLNLDEI